MGRSAPNWCAVSRNERRPVREDMGRAKVPPQVCRCLPMDASGKDRLAGWEEIIARARTGRAAVHCEAHP